MASYVEDGEDVLDILAECCHGDRFRVSSAYEFLRHHEPKVTWNKVVWEGRNTPKHSFILWLAMVGKLSTLDRLSFIDVDPRCRFCRDDLENHSHLFFECDFARDVWAAVREEVRLPNGLDTLDSSVAWLDRNARRKDWSSRAMIYALSTTVYYIWYARNALVFYDSRFRQP